MSDALCQHRERGSKEARNGHRVNFRADACVEWLLLAEGRMRGDPYRMMMLLSWVQVSLKCCARSAWHCRDASTRRFLACSWWLWPLRRPGGSWTFMGAQRALARARARSCRNWVFVVMGPPPLGCASDWMQSMPGGVVAGRAPGDALCHDVQWVLPGVRRLHLPLCGCGCGGVCH